MIKDSNKIEVKKKYAIQVDDLTVAYNYKPVLWDIDLAIPEGVLMAIVGPNGAGKSTLIKSILGIIKPIAGTVRVFGKDYKKQVPVVVITGADLDENDKKFLSSETTRVLEKSSMTDIGIADQLVETIESVAGGNE